MTRTTYVYDKELQKVVPSQEYYARIALKERGTAPVVVGDIAEFRTTDGVTISSRSHLRAYEQERGVKQVGTDWTGSAKPAFWDAHQARERAKGR
jgi:hypothetical protein